MALETSAASSPNSIDPFEEVLVWPRVTPTDPSQRKRRAQEHVPCVATSDRWLQWYKKKDLEKKEIEDAKKARIEERKMKKQKRDEEKLQKSALKTQKENQPPGKSKKKAARTRKVANT